MLLGTRLTVVPGLLPAVLSVLSVLAILRIGIVLGPRGRGGDNAGVQQNCDDCGDRLEHAGSQQGP